MVLRNYFLTHLNVDDITGRGDPPREGAGSYDFCPWETEFFALTKDAGWNLPYGKFFMEWYSNKLVQHAGDVIDAVKPAVASAVSSNGSRSTVRSLACRLIIYYVTSQTKIGGHLHIFPIDVGRMP